LTPSELALDLAYLTRNHALLNERRAVTPDLAHRLARVFKTTPEFWLRLQEAVDIGRLQANGQEYDAEAAS